MGREPQRWGRGHAPNSQIWWRLEMGRHLSGARAWCPARVRAPRPALPPLAVSRHLAGHPASLSMQRVRPGLPEVPLAPYCSRVSARVGTPTRLGFLPGKGEPSAPRSLPRPSSCRWPAACTPSNAISLPGGEAGPLNTAPRGQAQGTSGGLRACPVVAGRRWPCGAGFRF